MPENLSALQVYDRCGDEWITVGEAGVIVALPSPSIESAMNITGITDLKERRRVYDQVKRISREVAKESFREREKMMAKEARG